MCVGASVIKFFLVFSLSGALVVGCSSETAESDSATADVTMILPSQDSAYFEAVAEGVREGAEGSGVSLQEISSASTVGSQVAAVTSAVAEGTDAILIAPAGLEVDAALETARQAGAVVVDIGGTGYASEAADFLVQTDDCVLGIAAGQWMQGRMPQGSLLWPEFAAHFLLVLGDDGEYPIPTCRDQGWFEGAGIPLDALMQSMDGEVAEGEFSGIPYSIPCVVRYEGDAQATQAQITACVREHPEINAAYASTGTLARVAGEGLRLAGKTVGLDVVVATVAGQDEGLALAQGSWVNAASRPRARATGGFALASALTLLSGETPETQGDKPFLDTGVDLCTDNPQTAVFTAITLPIDECL